MKREPQGIVASLFGRMGRTPAYAQERARLVAEARVRRADELACASPWRRIRVNWEIERDVRAKLEKTFPRWALYTARRRP